MQEQEKDIIIFQGEMKWIGEIKNKGFNSSNPQIAAVENNDFIVAKKPGRAVVSGLLTDGRTCRIPVKVVRAAYDDFDRMRRKMRERLIPYGKIDLNNPAARAAVAEINRTAAINYAAMRRTFDDGDVDSIPWDLLVETTRNDFALYPQHTTYDNLLALVKGFLVPGPFYHNSQLYGDIVRAMRWLLHNSFRGNLFHPDGIAVMEIYGDTEAATRGAEWSGNWWHMDIGVPLAVGKILTLLYDTGFPEELLAAYLRRLHIYTPNATARVAVGGLNGGSANQAHKCVEILTHGLLAKNEARVRQALAEVLTEATVPYVTAYNEDGYYWDGSYVEHGQYPYVLGYGLGCLQAIVEVIGTVGGQSLGEIPLVGERVYMERIGEFIEKTWLTVLWRGGAMPGLAGRGVSRQDNLHEQAKQVCQVLFDLLPVLPPDSQAAVKSAVKNWIFYTPSLRQTSSLTHSRNMALLMADDRIIPGEPVGLYAYNNESRVFWRQPDFTFGISFNHCNAGIAPVENGNGENRKGTFTGDGMTYLFPEGDHLQYTGHYFATADYLHLPGTTLGQTGLADYQVPANRPGTATGQNSGLNPGHTLGGTAVLTEENGRQYGVTAFLMNLAGVCRGDGVPTPLGMDVTANKSWFMLGEKIIALGSGINSSKSHEVDTTVESRKLPTDSTAVNMTVSTTPNAAINTTVSTTPNTAVNTIVSTTSNPAVGTTVLTCDGKPVAAGETLTTDGGSIHLAYGSAQIGYFIPRTEIPLEISLRNHTAAWSETHILYSDLPVTEPYAEIIFHHGIMPAGGTYEYVLLPNHTPAETAAFAADPDYTVVAQTDTLHAVYDRTLKVLALVNFDRCPARVKSPGSGIEYEVSGAAAVLIKEGAWEGGSFPVRMAILDPVQSQSGDEAVIWVTVKRRRLGAILSKDGNISIAEQALADGREVVIKAASLRVYEGKRFHTWQAFFQLF